MSKSSSETRNKPPSGEVTLLFTDMAGSSRLWEQHGDRFIPVWQAHDAVMRDAIQRFGGYEVKSEGDSFMVAFSDAAAALHCALFAQVALSRYPWPDDIGAPRVRMGLHTGEPFVHGDDYFGPVVNRAAHICSAARGGQALISEETRRAVAKNLDAKVALTELGDFRLKDMGAPIRLYQAQHPSVGESAFPPPRTLEGRPNNLPLQRTSFVGRAEEIERIAAYLAQGEKPLLAVTGPGGIGKTRLTLQAAAAKADLFPDGVFYVRLAEARDATSAAIEVAAAMNIPLNPSLSPMAQVRERLADRRCLLILDDAGAFPQSDRLIRDLLFGMADLRCLATSRESLNIAEGEEIPLAGLPTETTSKETQEISTRLEDTDAGRLFLDRALEANPSLTLTPAESADAEKLLRELEGVPNSIEKAAQLMDKVSPSVVLEWLNTRLAPNRIPPRSSPGVEKFRGILRRGAQKAILSVEQAAKAAPVNLSQLLQGIADIATDRNQEHASELGRESLRLSQEAGDELGVAAALRQLARVKWNQGDRQSAVAMLSVAAGVYRRQNSEESAEVQKELDEAREALASEGDRHLVPVTLERAVALAMEDAR